MTQNTPRYPISMCFQLMLILNLFLEEDPNNFERGRTNLNEYLREGFDTVIESG